MIGQLLNQYRIEEVVGQGGMGVVYRALDMNLERTVAVKVLSASFRDDPKFVERFHQEARIQAGLNHPNIATLFDFFVWNDMPVAVMEFIKGETLRSIVDRSGPIPAHIALPIFVQALQGVAAGHKRRIIHRDLKPSNLMLTDEGIVKVTDFGIAKVRSVTGHTEESTRVGSVRYMAPEQILGRPVDVQTDIYIMGGTLYELLTGRPPFQGVSQFEIDSAHVRDLPIEPTAYCRNIPPAAVAAIMRALAKEPSERFATADEFIQALPDLRGVPYVPADTVIGDETRQQNTAEITYVRPAETTLSDETQVRQEAPKSRARHAAMAIAATGLFVLSTLAEDSRPTPQTPITARTNTDRIAPTRAEATAPTRTEATAPTRTEATIPIRTESAAPTGAEAAAPTRTEAAAPTRDLTGMWIGTYLDHSGKALLQLLNLQMQQVPDGAITGRFTYQAGGSAGEECTLDRSTYSTQSKRLRLIIHCRNPNHPKYLNVPLEFIDVDPGASSIGGGRLASHLADDIVVTLERTKAI